MASAFYTFEPKVFGAFYSVGANLPYVAMDVTAALVTPLGTLKVERHASGLGDIALVPAMLAWKDGPCKPISARHRSQYRPLRPFR